MKNHRVPMLIALVLAAACDRSEPTRAKPAASTTVSSAGVATSAPTTTAVASQAAPAAPAARPLYYDQPITEADLAGRTLREYALLRNTIYARAGNSFRKPWLDTYFRAQAWYAPKDKMDESKITALDRANARKIADADAALPSDELERRRDQVLERRKAGKATADDAIELSLLSQRLGKWLGEEDDPAGERSPLADPTQLDRLLRVEELSTLSRRDLRILRNTIYARRGRPFDSAVVREYFKTAAWYKPDPGYHDGRLVEIDHKNIRIIQSVEQSLGGPLHENPDYGKDGWFVMA